MPRGCGVSWQLDRQLMHVCESGELIVHLALIPMEEREVRLSASVTATGMTNEEVQ